MHTAEHHSGLTFTLNLSAACEKALLRSDNPARAMSDRINRALKALGCAAPAYGFALEISPAGRVHLHGAVLPGAIDLDTLKRALMKAGGKLKSHAASRQLKFKPFDPTKGAHGWTGYITQDERITRRALATDKITFISSGLRRLTRSDWEAFGKATRH